MKNLTKYIASAVLCLWLLPLNAFAKELVPVGQVIGLELQDNTVTVAAFDEELGAASKEAGLAAGDRILKLDGREIRTAEDVRKALEQSKGSITITVSRGGKEKTFRLSPEITTDGPKLGIYLRQGVTGIGTVTYYDPDTGEFGTLGHGVNNSSGQLLTLTQGSAYDARVLTVRKGKAGEPGQLMGSIESRTPIGTLRKNTAQGVFGSSAAAWEGQAVPVAASDEIQAGKATILSTIAGNEVREYSVEILKIYPKSRQNGRNILLKVTDPALLEGTGGIVQGMSGSPIIQNGKLIGAVTHVLVNDPTTGYGIFIENMLDAAA